MNSPLASRFLSLLWVLGSPRQGGSVSVLTQLPRAPHLLPPLTAKPPASLPPSVQFNLGLDLFSTCQYVDKLFDELFEMQIPRDSDSGELRQYPGGGVRAGGSSTCPDPTPFWVPLDPEA